MAIRDFIPIGKKFNSLTFIEDIEQPQNGRRIGLFRCVCGKERIMYVGNVKRGLSTSCGCRGERRNKRLDGTDRMEHLRAHQIWVDMIRRCEDTRREDFHNYGGRGIKVCERWRNSLKNFVDDMGDPPEGMTLDRFPDMNGDYSKDNCRWATYLQQNTNRRNTPFIEFNGRRQAMSDWAREIGISYYTLRRRILEHGWTVERALTTPAVIGRNQYE